MVIQLVYMGELGYLAIKGIKPNIENPLIGEIHICYNPLTEDKIVPYHIEKDMIYLEEIAIPMSFILQFLSANDCVQIGEDGQGYVILKEVGESGLTINQIPLTE